MEVAVGNMLSLSALVHHWDCCVGKQDDAEGIGAEGVKENEGEMVAKRDTRRTAKLLPTPRPPRPPSAFPRIFRLVDSSTMRLKR